METTTALLIAAVVLISVMLLAMVGRFCWKKRHVWMGIKDTTLGSSISIEAGLGKTTGTGKFGSRL